MVEIDTFRPVYEITIGVSTPPIILHTRRNCAKDKKDLRENGNI